MVLRFSVDDLFRQRVHANGIAAWSDVPLPGGAADLQMTAERFDAVCEPKES
jgi:hypothetical protein